MSSFFQQNQPGNIGMPNLQRLIGMQTATDEHGREDYMTVNGVHIPKPGRAPKFAHLPDEVSSRIESEGRNPQDYYMDGQGNLLSLANQAAPSAPATGSGAPGQRQAPPPDDEEAAPPPPASGPAQAGAGGPPVQQDPQASRVGMYAQQASGQIGVQGGQPGGYQPSPYERAYMQAMNTMHDLAYAAADPDEAWRQGIKGPVQADPRYVAAMQQVDALGGLISQQMMADVERQRVGVNERELDLRQQQNEYERGLLTDPNALAVSFARENGLPPQAIPGLVAQFESMYGKGDSVPASSGPAGNKVLTSPEQQLLAGNLPDEAQRLLNPNAQGYTPGASIPSIVETLDRLNVSGLEDPNSDVGRLLRSEMQSRYGNDEEALLHALLYPDMDDPSGGNWVDRNIGSLGIGLLSLGGYAPWAGDSMQSLWYQGQEGENRKRAVDLYNLYQQQLGGRQIGWQGRDFGFLPQR